MPLLHAPASTGMKYHSNIRGNCTLYRSRCCSFLPSRFKPGLRHAKALVKLYELLSVFEGSSLRQRAVPTERVFLVRALTTIMGGGMVEDNEESLNGDGGEMWACLLENGRGSSCPPASTSWTSTIWHYHRKNLLQLF